MAALSDYLESALLNHIFRNSSFSKPTNISIALTGDPPLDSDSGSSLPELASGVQKGTNFVTTNYKRLSLGNPVTEGNTKWSEVGLDNTTTFQVLGTSNSGNSAGISGYFYPLYLNENSASEEAAIGLTLTYRFTQFPGVLFFAPEDLVQSGVNTNPGFTQYDGNGFIKNSAQFVFDTALEDWGWVSGVAIVDSSGYKQGNVLMYSKLSNPRYVYTGDNIKFDLNSLEINLQ
jgi:hypothetical protein